MQTSNAHMERKFHMHISNANFKCKFEMRNLNATFKSKSKEQIGKIIRLGNQRKLEAI